MKGLLLISLIFFFAFGCVVRQQSVDSLREGFQKQMKAESIDSCMTLAVEAYNKGQEHYDNKNINNAFIYFEFADSALIVLSEYENSDKDSICNLLNTIAWRYRLEDQYVKSSDLLKQSVKIRKSSSFTDTIGLYQSYNRLRIIYGVMSKFKSADKYSDTANTIIEKIYKVRDKFPVELALNYQSDAVRCIKLNQNKRAYDLLMKSKPIWEELDSNKNYSKQYRNKKLSNFNNVLGWYYSESDSSFHSVEKAYKKSISLMKDAGGNYAGRMNKLSLIYKNRGEFKSADSLIDLSLKYFDSVNITSLKVNRLDAILNKADLCVEMGKIKEAEKLYRNIDTLKKYYGESHPDFISHENLKAKLFLEKGQESEAFRIFSKNFSLSTKKIANNFQWLSDNEKAFYWKKELRFFEDVLRFVNTNHSKIPKSVSLSYDVALVVKSKLLESKIIKGDFRDKRNKTENSLEVKTTNLQKLESAGSDDNELMEKLRHEVDSLDNQLEISWPAYAEQKRNLLITWKKVQDNLDQGEVAIEFVRFREYKDSAFQYQALIIRKDLELPVLATLCDESMLTELEPRIDFGEYYSLVWQSIEKHLKGIHTIYYAPVGELYNLPFHSFLVPRKKEGQRYLMDKYNLHQLTSTRYLALGLKEKQKERFNSSIFIVGGVNYDYLPGSSNNVLVNSNLAKTRDFDSLSLKVRFLPGTVEEANAIESILSKNSWETTYLKGENATEEKLREFSDENAKGVMHIATHGYAFPEYSSKDTTVKENSIRYSYRYSNNPMVRSGLVLAGGNWKLMGSDTLTRLGVPENGVLTALEVSGLNLRNTKLVVLSACKTGLGKIEGSEGTFGLKRGFKLAGVEQMILSLWSVPDKETNELMTFFYKDLDQTMEPVSSFQKAQNQMRDKYPLDPEKWAGFVLVR
ncbi:CHAT domain-containing protein [bacterium]|nr:CHAT domain-containing protein [bacterium]